MPGGSCQIAERTLSCALPEIAAGGRTEISVTGTLRSNAAAAQLLNGVQIQPSGFAPRSAPRPPAPPTSPPAPAPPGPPLPLGSPGPLGPLPAPPATGAATPPGEVVRPAADVGVAKVVTQDPLARDGRATWRIRTTNHGPSTATNVTIRDTLPTGARFVRATGAGRCTAKGRVVTCRLGDLRAARSVETAIVAKLSAGGNAGHAAQLDRRRRRAGRPGHRQQPRPHELGAGAAADGAQDRQRSHGGGGGRPDLHAAAAKRRPRHGPQRRAVRPSRGAG